jgi:hypothetical protein
MGIAPKSRDSYICDASATTVGVRHAGSNVAGRNGFGARAVWLSSPDPAARWLALRVLVRVACEQGWTEARRERLGRYRNDPSPFVAGEAALTFPPEPAAPARK